VAIIAIAMNSSPSTYGQAPSSNGEIGTPQTSGKPSEPGQGGGDRALTLPPAAAPPNNAISTLAGGGYADPHYVPPGKHLKAPTRHRTTRTRRPATAHPFVGYNSYKAFPYQYWYCHCDYY